MEGSEKKFKLTINRNKKIPSQEEENKKSEALRKEIEDLRTSDEKLEKIAREKYGMTKEGEKIQKIYIDSTK